VPVKKRLNPKKLEERRLKYKPDLRDRYRLKLKKKKPIRKSAEELYDSKRKSFRESKVENFGAGGVVKKVVKTILRDDYKPKLKNEKEVYSRVKQDYSDVIKNYEKTQKRKKRNRAAAVVGGAATAVAIQSKKDKQNKK
jgi:hypothetical protein